MARARTVNVADYIGKQFGKWTIIENAGRDKQSRILVKCRCECLKEKICKLSDIVGGYNRQCQTCAKKANASTFKYLFKRHRARGLLSKQQ